MCIDPTKPARLEGPPPSVTPGRPRVLRRESRLFAAVLASVSLASCDSPDPLLHHDSPSPLLHPIVPEPLAVETLPQSPALIGGATRIVVDPGSEAQADVAAHLARLLGNWASATPRIVEAGAEEGPGHGDSGREAYDSVGVDIRLTAEGADESLGQEGYDLLVSEDGVTVRGVTPAGVFYGVQTLRQLLPPEVEFTAALPRPSAVRAMRIRDRPRFSWRGSMLDVSRHFLDVHEVKRFIDLIVPYKLNHLHLHLSDDQGWRVDIPGWPDLARIGGSTEVGGGPGGFYTMDEYAEIVAYAAERFITVVPEIDVPGHVNAAMASYPALNCDDTAPELYTGIQVGFSALCVEKDITYRFLDDVVREISARTPGPYFHMGGDEVEELSPEEYADFIDRMSAIIRSHGKQMIGWDEIAYADVGEESIIQLWRPYWPLLGPDQEDLPPAAVRFFDGVERAVGQGARVILSPADRVYLDMKYDSATAIGLQWAALTDVRRAYDWSIREVFSTVPEEAILGIEAPLWSETLGTLNDFEYMAFPRLAAVAEIGWTAADRRDWPSFRQRLAAQGPRWSAQGVNFHRTPEIPWSDRPPEW